MKAWFVKSQFYDAKDALEIVTEQRGRGHNAWIEDEDGKVVDEESLKGDHVKQPTTPKEKAIGILVALGSAAAVLIVLWTVGVWVDH